MNTSLKDSRINKAVTLFTSGQLNKCLSTTLKLIKIYPTEPFLFNLSGVVNASMRNYEKAIQSYKKALLLNSGYIEVYNNIGVAYKEWGKSDIALKYLKEAIRLNPSYSEAYNNLGNAQKDLSQLDEAIDNYSKAIELNPSYVDAMCNKGISLALQEKYEKSLELYQNAMALSPENIDTQFLYASLLLTIGRSEDAKKNFISILTKRPNHPDALNGLGLSYLSLNEKLQAKKSFLNVIRLKSDHTEGLTNYGFMLQADKEFKKSIEIFKKICDIDPYDLRALSNLGKAYFDSGDLKRADLVFRKGIAIDSNYLPIQRHLVDLFIQEREYEKAEKMVKEIMAFHSESAPEHSALGSIFEKKGQLANARKHIDKALKIDPAFSHARINLATLEQHHGKNEEAKRIYESLLIDDQENSDLRNNLANLYLTEGRYGEGWSNYEYRWKVSPLVNAVWPIKGMDIWNGEKDKEVVLWREQGIGDDILFLGLTPEARDRSKRLSVYVDPRLVVLCRRSIEGVEFFPYESVIEDVMECHLPMGSLPRLFRQTEDDFKKTKKGYLKADPERVSAIRTELGLEGKKVIGISWKSIKSLNTLKKSLTLLEFGKIFEGLDVTLVNLQYGDVDQEIREFEEELGIKIVQCDSVDNREDLDGLAALIEACDLVVSTSNVTIHLAGALGKDTWVLLPYVSSFWWLLNREDSIWYPSLKIFRQKKFGEWKSALDLLRNDICTKYS